MKGWIKSAPSGSAYFNHRNPFHILAKRDNDWIVKDIDTSAILVVASTRTQAVEFYKEGGF